MDFHHEKRVLYLRARFYGAYSAPPVFAAGTALAKQLEPECLAEEHAASGIEPGTTTLSANTQWIDSPHKSHVHVDL